MITVGGCILADYCRCQSVQARSSAEAEWYSQVTLASEGILIKNVLEFLLMEPVGLELLTDSTSAKAIGARQGVGRVRHLEVATLWLQDRIKKKVLSMSKVGTASNLADLGTKVHQAAAFRRLRDMNYVRPPGKAAGTPDFKVAPASAVSAATDARVGAIVACVLAAMDKLPTAGADEHGSELTCAGSEVAAAAPARWRLGGSALALLVGAVAVWTCIVLCVWTFTLWRCGCLHRHRAQGTTPKTRRHVRVQSMTTYDRWRTHPRFRYLNRDGDHGAWSD